LPWFAFFYTKTARYQAWVTSIQRPSGQPNINKEEFKSLLIPLPDLGEQEKLVMAMKRALDQARRLRAEAAKEWEDAKTNFERRLLDNKV